MTEAQPHIPEGVIERLPAYLNVLLQLQTAGNRPSHPRGSVNWLA